MRHLLVGLSLFILTVSSLIAGNVRISDRNPAAIRQVVTNGSQVTLNLQFVNQRLPTMRCICPENTLASQISENNGKEPLDLRSKEIRISDRNPAVIVSGVIKGDTAVLKMQFVNSSLPTYRCICPDNAFSSQVNENNGQFQIYTKASWVKENLPEVFEDKEAISNKFRESSNVPVFMGSVSLQYSGMSELRSIELGSGSVQWVQYTRASEDAFSLGEFKPFQIMTAGKPGAGSSATLTQGQEPIHKFSLPNDNPAALRFIEEGEDGWKTLHLQIVNKQLMLARCICPLTQVHGAINEARGNFTVKVAPEMANKILGDISNETLTQKWQEDNIYIISGTVLATAVNDGVVQAYLGTDGQIQEGTYAYAREDAFEFDGIMSDSYSAEGESGEQTTADPFFDGLNFDN